MHCRDSHMLHIKNGSKSNTNSNFQANLRFSQRILTIFQKKIMLTMMDTGDFKFKIGSIIKEN